MNDTTPLAVVIPDELRRIGHLLRTQDNRCTDQPMFIVQQHVEFACDDERTSGFESVRYIWVHDGEEVHDPRAARLEKHFKSSHGEIPEGYERVCFGTTWEFVTACFTEQGCKDHIARNGHNLRSPRIYAEGSFRNPEFRVLRNWLMSLPAPDEVPA